MSPPAMRLVTLLVAAGLVAGACQSSTTVTDSGEPSAPSSAAAQVESATSTPVAATAEASTQAADPAAPTPEPQATVPAAASEPADAVSGTETETFVPAQLRAVINNIADGFTTGSGAWEGFEPNDYPVVLALKDSDGKLTGALAINHPRAVELGNASALDISGTPFASLHLIADPTDSESLQALETFNFRLLLGGVESFAMVAGGRNQFFAPTTKIYVSTLVHEMFHRYQGDVFAERGAEQDIDGYNYEPESLVLIGLEERALSAAINAETDEARERAARHFIAIRNSRLATDSRVALDGRQEIREGTARYLEHLLAGSDTSYPYHLTNFADQLVDDISSVNVKGSMAFGRWYASGAATLHLLALLEAEQVSTRVEAGEAPVEVLAQLLGVEQAEYGDLVAEAFGIYDPTSELPEQARSAAEAVQQEPNFWGEDPADGEQVILTQVEFECLVDRGVIFTAELLEISDADWEACYNQP